MAKKPSDGSVPARPSLNLFDLIEIEEAKEDPDNCQHTHEEKTFTVWPHLPDERMTFTCKACGKVRGRVTG